MRIGIIGAGTIGEKHAAAAQKAGLEVAWVIDPNRERSEALAQKFGAQADAAPDALWRDESTRAVIVGVPNWLHKSLAVAALESGKDLLLEKPMALNAAECRFISEQAQLHNRVLQVGFVHRYTSVVCMAKRLAEEKRLGDIYYSHAFLFLRRGVPGLGKWFTQRKFSGGGALIDVGVHLIDTALHVLGFPAVKEVSGQTFSHFGVRMADYRYESMWAGPPDLSGRCDVEDAAQALVRFDNGAVLNLHVAWAGNYAASLPLSQMSFCGSDGGMSFELFGDKVHYCHETGGTLANEEIPVEDNDFYYEQLVDFKHSVEARTVGQGTAAQGTQVQSIVDAVYQSSATGATVVLQAE